MDETPKPPLARRDLGIGAMLLLVVFVVQGLSPNATPFDSRWCVPVALSILNEGNTDLNEYLPLLEKNNFYMIECLTPGPEWKLIHSREECPTGRLHNFYSVAVPFLATPVIGTARAGIRLAQPVLAPLAKRISSESARAFLRGDFVASSPLVEVLVASLFIALATVVMYFLAREFLDRGPSLVVALVFAFGTPAWSLASRALWQHGPSMMLLALALLLGVRARRVPRGICLMGAVLALSFFVRASNAVSIVVFTVFVLMERQREFWWYILGAAPVSLAFAAYNWTVYGALLAPYSWAVREGAPGLGLHDRFFEALAGNLISPGRGFFVYVPVATLSIYGACLRPDTVKGRIIRPYIVSAVLLHLVLISSFTDWIGGHSFGPRYMSDMTPYLVYFLIPVVKRLGPLIRRRAYTLPAAFAALAIVSVWIHWQGATRWACWDWNVAPVDINVAQERVWDWRDPAFLRGIRGGAPVG